MTRHRQNRRQTSRPRDEGRPAPPQPAVGDVVSGIVFDANLRGIALSVGDAIGVVPFEELPLSYGETPDDRYAMGDTVEAVVGGQDEDGILVLSVRRNLPTNIETLESCRIGDVVIGTVCDVATEGIGVLVGELFEWIHAHELPLTRGQTPYHRYTVGDYVEALVWMIEQDYRQLRLSIRRNTHDYLNALSTYNVGDLVPARVLAVAPEGILLDLNGVIGQCHVPELTLSGNQVPSDRYAVGDTVEAFIWQIGLDERVLYLSVRRNAPGYVEALNALSVGLVVSATVTGFEGSGGLWLDVGGVVGGISLWELSFADAESTQSRYVVGDTVDDLFVWQVDHNQRSLGLSIRRNMPGYVEALNTHSIGDIVSGIVINVIDDALILDISGVIGSVGPQELLLAYGESAQDRYTIGDTVLDLLVSQVDRHARDLYVSVRRNAPGYVEALNAHSVGDVVSATIAAFEGRRIWLDVDGVIGDMSPWDLPLFGAESAQNHYAVGDTILDLFVWHVNRDDRALGLSARHSLSGYAKALNAYSVGDIVSATVVELRNDGGLWLEVGGVIGNVEPRELSLAGSESAQDHYVVGDIVDNLFVWWVNRDARLLALSVRRNVPGYIEAFSAYSIGDVISATVIGLQVDGGLWLDVGGVIGGVPPWELPLADDGSTQDHYTAGNIIHDLFVWQVNHSDRELVLSARRNAPSYIKALADVSVGDHLDGIVTRVYKEGLWLDAAGVFGWLPAQEMQIDKDQSPPMRYADGDSIKARVWQIDWASRTVIFSLRHLGRDSF